MDRGDVLQPGGFECPALVLRGADGPIEIDGNPEDDSGGDEIQAVADALSLLANILMAWNTAQRQQVFDQWAQRRGGAVPPELIGRLVPTRTEGINLRGVFRFPVERYADKILPSAGAEKTMAGVS